MTYAHSNKNDWLARAAVASNPNISYICHYWPIRWRRFSHLSMAARWSSDGGLISRAFVPHPAGGTMAASRACLRILMVERPYGSLFYYRTKAFKLLRALPCNPIPPCYEELSQSCDETNSLSNAWNEEWLHSELSRNKVRSRLSLRGARWYSNAWNEEWNTSCQESNKASVITYAHSNIVC